VNVAVNIPILGFAAGENPKKCLHALASAVCSRPVLLDGSTDAGNKMLVDRFARSK
jgi:hypothetical protein